MKLLTTAILAMAFIAPASGMVLSQSELACEHTPTDLTDGFNAVTSVRVEDGKVDRILAIQGHEYHATSPNAEDDGKSLTWYFPDGKAFWAFLTEKDETRAQFVIYIAEDRLYTKVWQCDGAQWEPNTARID
ncbi:hypothetical protein VPZ60_004324 [Salmonella enterica]|nr:hypothetical protein [Salmonella enterica]